MQAVAKKTKYCGCLYLEAGMHIIGILHFISMAVALLAMPTSIPFTIIFLLNIITMTLIICPCCNEKAWTRLLYLVFVSSSAAAEIGVGIWLTLKISKKLPEDDDEYVKNFWIIAGASIGAYIIAKIFTVITVYKYFQEEFGGGIEEGKNIHSKLATRASSN